MTDNCCWFSFVGERSSVVKCYACSLCVESIDLFLGMFLAVRLSLLLDYFDDLPPFLDLWIRFTLDCSLSEHLHRSPSKLSLPCSKHCTGGRVSVSHAFSSPTGLTRHRRRRED
jgi:hypothetical protein